MGGCLRSKRLDHRSGPQAFDWVGSLNGLDSSKGWITVPGLKRLKLSSLLMDPEPLLTVDWVGSLIMSAEPWWSLNGSDSPFRGSGSLNGLDHCKGI